MRLRGGVFLLIINGYILGGSSYDEALSHDFIIKLIPDQLEVLINLLVVYELQVLCLYFTFSETIDSITERNA
jgi:hypothetical protein